MLDIDSGLDSDQMFKNLKKIFDDNLYTPFPS